MPQDQFSSFCETPGSFRLLLFLFFFYLFQAWWWQRFIEWFCRSVEQDFLSRSHSPANCFRCFATPVLAGLVSAINILYIHPEDGLRSWNCVMLFISILRKFLWTTNTHKKAKWWEAYSVASVMPPSEIANDASLGGRLGLCQRKNIISKNLVSIYAHQQLG